MILTRLSCICPDMGQFALQMTNAFEAAGQGGDIAPRARAPFARRRWPEAFDQGPTQPEHLELLHDHAGGASDQDDAKDEDDREAHAAVRFGSGKSVADRSTPCSKASSRTWRWRHAGM
jgi:hypothetical protein